jgi:flagellar motor switch protein FliN/FliY
MADDSQLVNQDEIERLLQQSSKQPSPDEARQEPAQPEASSDNSLSQSDIEALLNQGVQDEASPSSAAPHASQVPDASAPASAKVGLQQDDVDQLLGRPGAGPSSTTEPSVPRQKTSDRTPGEEGTMGQADIEYLLNQAEKALDSIDSESRAGTPPGLAPFRLEEFRGEPASTESATLDLISDVRLDVKIELGRTNMYLEDVLKLRKGAVVPLDKLAGDPVDIYVNERLIARGEVLVLNDNFCVRVGELVVGSSSGS